ncbi:MAG: carboxypeptidase-like regulatory domain-containing protein, partial [Bacteroidetes bacterium]|nr:carboxypeptidase-like regulatory domain-containing protein [Bacteroidota bacterium]
MLKSTKYKNINYPNNVKLKLSLMKNKFIKLCLTLVLFASMVASVVAQVTTASISGKVLDQNKEPLIGATVVAKHVPTGTVYGTSVLSDGRYSISGMRVGGPYEIEVSIVGYGTQKTNNLFLTVGEEATQNF